MDNIAATIAAKFKVSAKLVGMIIDEYKDMSEESTPVFSFVLDSRDHSKVNKEVTDENGSNKVSRSVSKSDANAGTKVSKSGPNKSSRSTSK